MPSFDPTRVLRVVRFWDPAIDMVETEISEYVAKRDPKTLKLREGIDPMWFHLRPLTVDQVTSIMSGVDETSVAKRNLQAFSLAVIQVDNFKSASGETYEKWIPERWASAEGATKNRIGEIVQPHEREEFGAAIVQEIGHVAFERSFLPIEAGGSYTLPASCLLIAGQMSALYAAAAVPE